MKLNYLGPVGSYSHIAAQKWQQENDPNQSLELVPQSDFETIAKRVKTSSDMGLLPIENSTTSNVHENIDRLFLGELCIVGELSLQINLHLFTIAKGSLATIRTVLSHPKALAQVKTILDHKQWLPKATSSTAQAAREVVRSVDPTLAVLGPKTLIEHHPSLHEQPINLNTQQQNQTRFVIVQATPPEMYKPTHTKATFIFTIPHRPGSLAEVLSSLAQAKINLTKIESRPIPSKPGEYAFWIDVVGKNQTALRKTKKILENKCSSHTLLGTYKVGVVYDS